MDAFALHLATPEATAGLGRRLAPLLRVGDVVGLSGPLGAGKSTLARGAIEAFSGEREAPSPTFPLVEIYPGPGFDLWHFDLYRLAKREDAFELGIEEAFAHGASLIEWAERVIDLLPAHALAIRLDPAGAKRIARLAGGGDWQQRLEALARAPESTQRS
jgi:tRNA threonylcarbamoyl adenosine modification protein YjeE